MLSTARSATTSPRDDSARDQVTLNAADVRVARRMGAAVRPQRCPLEKIRFGRTRPAYAVVGLSRQPWISQ